MALRCKFAAMAWRNLFRFSWQLLRISQRTAVRSSCPDAEAVRSRRRNLETPAVGRPSYLANSSRSAWAISLKKSAKPLTTVSDMRTAWWVGGCGSDACRSEARGGVLHIGYAKSRKSEVFGEGVTELFSVGESDANDVKMKLVIRISDQSGQASVLKMAQVGV